MAALAAQAVLGGALIFAPVNGFAVIGGGGSDHGGARVATAAPAARVDRFDASRAFALLRAQVAVGQRPAGSPQLRRLAVRLRALLPHARFEDFGGGERNIVGVLPGRLPATVIGAHYDSEAHPPGFVGANDSAAGTA
ncbi:MAG TPA: hypothetical protein VIM22_09770, partial [Solirubrobacteraceae bacterium]